MASIGNCEHCGMECWRDFEGRAICYRCRRAEIDAEEPTDD